MQFAELSYPEAPKIMELPPGLMPKEALTIQQKFESSVIQLVPLALTEELADKGLNLFAEAVKGNERNE
jgi:hypothetical protein